MMRFAVAVLVSLALGSAVRAADLPTGTWAANLDGNTGDLVITEVKAGKVTGSFLGTDFTGTWRDKTLVFAINDIRHEAQLVSEPAEKGKTKYTLTGTREENVRVPTRVAIHKVKVGWYAQITAAAPAIVGEIKAEVRGVLVYEGHGKAYVEVKHKGETADIRIWVYTTEDEWHKLAKTLRDLNGKEVIVAAPLAKALKGADANIPEGAMMFLGKFDPKPADPPK